MGDLEPSAFIYRPINYPHGLNEDRAALKSDWWRAGHAVGSEAPCRPVPLSHSECRVYTGQTASTLSVNILGEGQSLCGFGVVCGSPSCGSGGEEWCPQLPASECQSGGRSEGRPLPLGYHEANHEARGLPRQPKPKADSRSHPNHSSQNSQCEIRPLEPPSGNTGPHFPARIYL